MNDDVTTDSTPYPNLEQEIQEVSRELRKDVNQRFNDLTREDPSDTVRMLMHSAIRGPIASWPKCILGREVMEAANYLFDLYMKLAPADKDPLAKHDAEEAVRTIIKYDI